MINVAVFASGSGTNAENIIKYFANNKFVRIQCVFTNNAEAGVIQRCGMLNVPCYIFSKPEFENKDGIIHKLKEEKINFIVLAGFLWLIPKDVINNFKDRIINIHPALLPSYGGRGFFGKNVHQSVIDSGDIVSGITIHHVNEKFDEGKIIFQAACHVSKDETVNSLANKIHKLEYTYFPVVIEKLITRLTIIN